MNEGRHCYICDETWTEGEDDFECDGSGRIALTLYGDEKRDTVHVCSLDCAQQVLLRQVAKERTAIEKKLSEAKAQLKQPAKNQEFANKLAKALSQVDWSSLIGKD
jgi:hypothetical protein